MKRPPKTAVRQDVAPASSPPNTLYYGDNLDVLRKHIKDESVDLIYLDPPFKSNQSYNVLFSEHDGAKAAAQVQAFEDTWHWDANAEFAFQETVEAGGKVAEALLAFRTLVGTSDMLAYLAMMAPRLKHLHRVLTPTGSLYLHCDPTASHYLKLLLDAVFTAGAFLGEIVWRRTTAHATTRRWARLHDVILSYAKNPALNTFHPPKEQPDADWISREYRHEDERGRYMLDNLTAAGTRNGPSGQPWRGVDPAGVGAGRHWRYIPETLDRLDGEGRIYWPTKGKYPKLKHYYSEDGGKSVGDLWADISPVGRTAAERVGYPTQKPVALVDRIIQASSNPGEVVLDPFCGCGTAIAAAQQSGRRWIGIDVTQVAIKVIRDRLEGACRLKAGADYVVRGEPTTLEDARALALDNRFEFQVWAINLLAGRPVDQRKGRDQGIDGKLFFHDESPGGRTKVVIISVKSGKPGVTDVRELIAVAGREKATLAVLVTLEDPTRDMRAEAARAGQYESPGWRKKYPRLQIITVEGMLHGGDRIQMPPQRQTNVTFDPPEVTPPARKKRVIEGPSLFDE